MKTWILWTGLCLGAGTTTLAQQPAEQTDRRLRRTETRTTTPELYKERDTILVLLKRRLAALQPAGGPLAPYFSGNAEIRGLNGKKQKLTEFEAQPRTGVFRNGRVLKLEINEGLAQAVEVYEYTTPGTGGKADSVTRKATLTSNLRKGAGSAWRIEQMRITSTK